MVVGVDACHVGWVGVALDPDVVAVHCAPTVAELIALIGPSGRVDVVAMTSRSASRTAAAAGPTWRRGGSSARGGHRCS